MISLTPSDIIQYLFCPRFTYYEYVLRIPRYEERHFKVIKGRNIHELKALQNKEYLRKRIGVVNKALNVYLTNNWLRGEMDELLWLKDGTMAPLDYKFALYPGKVYGTTKVQLAAYAVLIEENYQKPVHKGYVVYVRSKNKLVEVPITEGQKNKVKQAVKDMEKIITENFYPKATRFKKKCLTCTYRNICTR